MDRCCLPETKGESETKHGFPSLLRAEQQRQDKEQRKGNAHTNFYFLQQTHRPSSIRHLPVIYISPLRQRKESECLNWRFSSSDFNSQLEMSGMDPTEMRREKQNIIFRHTQDLAPYHHCLVTPHLTITIQPFQNVVNPSLERLKAEDNQVRMSLHLPSSKSSNGQGSAVLFRGRALP